MFLHGDTDGRYSTDTEERSQDVTDVLVEEYLKADADYKRAKTETDRRLAVRDAIKAELVQEVGNQTTIATVSGTPRLRVNVSTSWRIDTKRLRNQAPDIAAMYEKESVSSRVEVL